MVVSLASSETSFTLELGRMVAKFPNTLDTVLCRPQRAGTTRVCIHHHCDSSRVSNLIREPIYALEQTKEKSFSFELESFSSAAAARGCGFAFSI